MAGIFLDRLRRIIDRTTSGRVGSVRVECKHFFSGAAVYASGWIWASLTPVGFAIKLPKKSRDIVSRQRGTKPLRYFAKGPVKKEYVVLPEAMVGDPDRLRMSRQRGATIGACRLVIVRCSKRSARVRAHGEAKPLPTYCPSRNIISSRV